MRDDPIQIVRARRDQLGRDIVRKRTELEVMAALLEECNQLLAQMLGGTSDKFDAAAPDLGSQPNHAKGVRVGAVPSLMLSALKDAQEKRADGLDRDILFAIVRRELPDVKQNTLRIALRRLVRKSKIVQRGECYFLATRTPVQRDQHSGALARRSHAT